MSIAEILLALMVLLTFFRFVMDCFKVQAMKEMNMIEKIPRCPHCGWDGVMRHMMDGHRMIQVCLDWQRAQDRKRKLSRTGPVESLEGRIAEARRVKETHGAWPASPAWWKPFPVTKEEDL